jgi:hypothetical protein
MFVPILPFLLIVAAFYCSLAYHETLSEAVSEIRRPSSAGTPVTAGTVDSVLKETPFNEIPFRARLALYYMGIFITAESAFILMAIKEYLQDLVGLTDFLILTGHPLRRECRRASGRHLNSASLQRGRGLIRSHSNPEDWVERA